MSLSLGFFIIRKGSTGLRLVALMLMLSALPLTARSLSAAELSTVRLVSSGTEELVFEFLAGELDITDIPAPEGARNFQVVRLAGCHLDVRQGVPMVPLRSVNLGTPPEGPLSFSILEDEYSEQEGVFLAPGPQLVPTAPAGTEPVHAAADGNLFYEEIYRPDSLYYERDVFIPEQVCFSGGEVFLRHQRILPLQIFPVQWNPVSKTLRIHHRIVVEVKFPASSGPQNGLSSRDLFQEIYHSTLLNDEQAAQWRRRPAAVARTSLPDQDPFSTSSDWFRISVRQKGIQRITGEDISQAGLDLSAVDPRTIKIYHMGRKILPRQAGNTPQMRQVPISVSGEQDGQFDSQDEILFYAMDLSGWEQMSQAGYGEYSNPYTNVNVFWLTYGGETGDRWLQRGGAPQATNYIPALRYKTVAHEERDFLNPDYSGLTWYWDGMTGHWSETIERRVTLSDVQAEDGMLKVRAKGIYYRPSDTVPATIPHHLYVYLNDATDAVIERLWFGALIITAEEQAQGLREGENVIKITLPRTESEWDHILFDWFEIQYWRGYGVVEDQLHFLNPDTSGVIQYELDGFTQDDILLLDVSDPWTPVEISGGAVTARDQDYTLRFHDLLSPGQSTEFYTATSAAYGQPVSLERRIPDDIRGISADVIMITPESFRQSLEPLAQLHRSEGLSVIMSDIEDIYDQFAWGLSDPTAIRDYLRHLYHLGSEPIPAYVLLFGDGNFDYRNNSGAGGNNWIPPYENGDLCTDDWFVRLDGDYVADMMIGRLPVRSVEEADVVVDKIVDYVNDPLLGPWRNRIMITSDDETGSGGSGNELFHTRDSEDMALHYIPSSYDQHKIYLMEYPMDWSDKKPQAQQAIVDGFNEGMLVINWIGHGNFDVWAHEDAFRGSNDIPKLDNGRRLPLVYSASCDVGRFDHTLNESISEELLRSREKGAVATIGATRSCFATPNAELNKETLKLLLGDGRLTLGQGLFGAKLKRPTSYSNDQKYALFGDPCMTLGKPQLESHIVTMSCDTLRALDHVTLEGLVLRDGVTDPTFTGEVSVRVFDSARPTTYFTEAGAQINYLLPGAPIFRGTSLVEDGHFEATFVVPKDISYGGRQARISAYSDDGDVDGLAYRDSLLVSGTVTAVVDTLGPSIALSVDGQAVVSGDFVSPDPTLVAHLEDENGINMTGEVGHWIVLLVDGGSERINVTENFQYDPGSYQRGSLEYTLTGLPSGSHTVTMKAWDNFNNFSTGTIEFEVSTETKLVLRDVLNCPNPFDPRSEPTLFTYQLSRPADVSIKIYTVAGRLIRTFHEGQRTSGYNTSQPWQGKDQDGDEIANGVYLYKVIARAEGRRAEAYGKVVVMR